MRLIITPIFILSLLPSIVFGKKHKLKPKDIIVLSDSLLNKHTGSALFKYCKLDEGSYYDYKKGDKLRYRPIFGAKKLHKRFYSAHMIYQFTMPYPECPDYDTVAGSIVIMLQKQDTLVVMMNGPDLSFIPEMAREKQACKFISSTEAINIARKDSMKLGVTAPYANVEYDPASRTFRWVVHSLMWNERDFQNDIPAQKDRVIIDAVTGAIIEHKVIPYTGEHKKDLANLE